MAKLSVANYPVARLSYLTGIDASGNVRHSHVPFVNVKDFGAVGDGVANDTAALQAAIASGAPVLYFPAGKYLITGQLNGAGVGEWIGAGPSQSYSEPTATEGTTIRCSGTNGGNAFIIAPRAMSGFHLDGIDKTGVGLDIGYEYYFRGFGNYKRITARRFDTAMRMFNLFNFYFESFIIEGNNKGVTARPINDMAVNGGDNGYFTTITWKDFYIRNNAVYGVNAYTPKGGKAWAWENVIIEANGASGTTQSWFEKLELTIRGAYFEDTPTKPAIQLSECSLSIDTGILNGTGGMSFTNNANKARLANFSAATSTDVITGLGGNCRLRLENCDLYNNVKDSASNVEIFNCYFAADGTTVASNIRSLQIGPTSASSEQPAKLSNVLVYRKTVSGTVPAGGRLEVVDRRASFGLWNSANGATIITPTLQVTGLGRWELIPYVVYGDTDNNFSVEIYNRSAADVTITNAVLTLMIVRSDYITIT